MSSPKSRSLWRNENAAWLGLFLPALSYFVSTRLTALGLFRSSTVGDVLPHTLQLLDSVGGNSYSCQNYHKAKRSRDFLYLPKNCQGLQYPVYTVLEDVTESIVSTTWKEDEELGRGYLLFSSSANKGRIFQWETGGGPIAIGRTLHLNDAGCRSNLYRNCDDPGSKNGEQPIGSGGIAVDMSVSESPRLMVAEYGEGRIIRLEENGARTPLIIQTPRTLGDESQTQQSRLCQPFRLLMTPHKDIMIMDDTSGCRLHSSNDDDDRFQLWRLPKATDIPALSNLAASRKAHAWTHTNSTTTPEPSIFFHSSSMGGMAIDTTGHGVFVTTVVDKGGESRVVVVRLALSQDDESYEDDESNQANNSAQSQIVIDYSEYTAKPGPIEIDNHGNIFLGVDDGILVVSKSQGLLSKVSFSITMEDPIVDLTVGSDKFLYMATRTRLMRFQVPGSPLVIDKKTLLKYIT
ncbi:MAG: hypothetical protein SGILL_009955 [Bacillariaceae sp.]